MNKLFIFIMLLFSYSAIADPHLATIEAKNGNVLITTSDFASAVGFESYTCNIDFGSWVFDMKAKKKIINNEIFYQCLYQGTLNAGVTYDVYFTFEDRPYMRRSRSATFKLRAD